MFSLSLSDISRGGAVLDAASNHGAAYTGKSLLRMRIG